MPVFDIAQQTEKFIDLNKETTLIAQYPFVDLVPFVLIVN